MLNSIQSLFIGRTETDYFYSNVQLIMTFKVYRVIVLWSCIVGHPLNKFEILLILMLDACL